MVLLALKDTPRLALVAIARDVQPDTEHCPHTHDAKGRACHVVIHGEDHPTQQARRCHHQQGGVPLLASLLNVLTGEVQVDGLVRGWRGPWALGAGAE